MYLHVLFYILCLISFGELAKLRIRDIPYFYKMAYWGIIYIIIFLSTFRWENGTDWKPYYEYYSLVGLFPEQAYMEPGFTLLCYIDYQWLSYTSHLGVIAILAIVPVARRIRDFSPFPLLSLLIWFSVSFAHMFPVRQTIAVSLFVFSWKYIQEKRFKPYICILIIAATFHYTVLIALPVYFLWHKYIPTKIYIWVIGIIVLASIIASNLISNLLYSLGGSFFEAKLNAYLDNPDSNFGSAYSPMQTLIRGCINRCFYFIFPLFFLNIKRKEIPVLNGMFNMYFYSFIVFIAVTPLSVALGRLTTYTDMSQLFLLPYIFNLKATSTSKTILMLIIISYLAVRFNGVIFNYRDLYIPYHCVLFN